MKIGEIMTRGAECAHLSDSIAHAAKRMKELNIGSLPVCGPDHKLVGIITDRDITIRATARTDDPSETSVEDVMTSDIVYCLQDQDVDDAAQLMNSWKIRRIAVVNGDKCLVGIVSLGDLAVKTDDVRIKGETLKQVSEPAAPRR